MIDASLEKLTQNSNFQTFHDLQSNLKVSEMGCKIKKILRGQSKLCLLVFNLKTGTFLPWDCQDRICQTIFGTVPPLRPLVGDLNNFYRHSNISYGDLLAGGVRVRG